MNITKKDFAIMGAFPVVQQIAGGTRAAYNGLKLVIDLANLIFAGINVSLEKRKLNNASLFDKPLQAFYYTKASIEYKLIKEETLGDLECFGLGLLSCIPVVATIYFGIQWHNENHLLIN